MAEQGTTTRESPTLPVAPPVVLNSPPETVTLPARATMPAPFVTLKVPPETLTTSSLAT